MGRPPIGKVAMSGAERTRLWRRKRAAAAPVTEPATKPAGSDVAKLKAEIARLKARIAELEKAGARSTNQQRWIEEEVIRRIAAADDLTRKNNKELRMENMRLNTYLNQRCVFTERQYNMLLLCAHPDNSASVEVRNEVLQLLVKHKRRLVKTQQEERELTTPRPRGRR